MNILITGATGFIGRRLLDYFIKRTDNNVITISRRHGLNPVNNRHTWIGGCDLSKPESQKILKYLNSEYKIDRVYHLSGHASASPGDFVDIYNNNVLSTLNLINNIDCLHFIYASSIKVYGQLSLPDESFRPRPQDDYSLSKYLAEEIIANKAKRAYSIFRLGPVVGKELTHGIIKDLEHKIIHHEKVELYGRKPGSFRSYIHIDDLIEVITSEKALCASCLNICSSQLISNENLANMVMKELNIFKPITFNNQVWPGDILSLSADNSRLINNIGYKPLDSVDAILKVFR